MGVISITVMFRVSINKSGREYFPKDGAADSEAGHLLCVVAGPGHRWMAHESGHQV